MGTLLRGDALLGSDLRGLRRGGGIEVTIASGGLLNCTRTIELNNQDLIVRTLVEPVVITVLAVLNAMRALRTEKVLQKVGSFEI